MAPVEVHPCSIQNIEDALAALEFAHLPDFVDGLALLVHAHYHLVAVILCLTDSTGMLACLEVALVFVRPTECQSFRGESGEHVHHIGQGLLWKDLAGGVHLVMDADDRDFLSAEKVTEDGELTAAADGMGEFADDDFIAAGELPEHVLPFYAQFFVVLIFYIYSATSVVLHPLDVLLQVVFKMLERHNISYSCHNILYYGCKGTNNYWNIIGL